MWRKRESRLKRTFSWIARSKAANSRFEKHRCRGQIAEELRFVVLLARRDPADRFLVATAKRVQILR